MKSCQNVRLVFAASINEFPYKIEEAAFAEGVFLANSCSIFEI